MCLSVCGTLSLCAKLLGCRPVGWCILGRDKRNTAGTGRGPGSACQAVTRANTTCSAFLGYCLACAGRSQAVPADQFPVCTGVFDSNKLTFVVMGRI